MSAAGIFFITAIMIIVYSDYRNFFYDEVNSRIDRTAQFVSERIESDIKELSSHVSFVASHNQMIRETVEAANALRAGVSEEENLRRMKDMDIDWSTDGWIRLKDSLLNNDSSGVLRDIQKSKIFISSDIFITDRYGALAATTDKTSDYFQADEEWWQRSYNNGLGAVYTTAMEWDESSNTYGFSIACPITSAEGKVIGIMKASIDENVFFRGIFKIFINDEWHAGIMSQTGSPVFTFSADHNISPKGILKSAFDIIVLKKGRGEKIVRDSEGKYYFLGFSKLQKSAFSAQEDNYVYFLFEASKITRLLQATVTKLFFICVIAALFLCFAVFLISKKAVSP
ncbi:MAG: cache domain-containing protein, partial [Bacteroidota bacterium]